MHLDSLLAIGLAGCVGVAFVLVVYALVAILAPKRPNALKNATYECGHEPIGGPWVPYRIQYYAFAIIFLIFDIETAFLYPWAIVYRKLGVFALAEMAVFIMVLVIGLVYAWKKGALKWA